jgi:hypothetical protein
VILIRDEIFFALKDLLEGPPSPIAFVMEEDWCVGIECVDRTMLMIGKGGTSEWRSIPIVSDYTSRMLQEVDIGYARFLAESRRL